MYPIVILGVWRFRHRLRVIPIKLFSSGIDVVAVVSVPSMFLYLRVHLSFLLLSFSQLFIIKYIHQLCDICKIIYPSNDLICYQFMSQKLSVFHSFLFTLINVSIQLQSGLSNKKYRPIFFSR
jgi:hypothetical protein